MHVAPAAKNETKKNIGNRSSRIQKIIILLTPLLTRVKQYIL